LTLWIQFCSRFIFIDHHSFARFLSLSFTEIALKIAKITSKKMHLKWFKLPYTFPIKSLLSKSDIEYLFPQEYGHFLGFFKRNQLNGLFMKVSVIKPLRGNFTIRSVPGNRSITGRKASGRAARPNRPCPHEPACARTSPEACLRRSIRNWTFYRKIGAKGSCFMEHYIIYSSYHFIWIEATTKRESRTSPKQSFQTSIRLTGGHFPVLRSKFYSFRISSMALQSHSVRLLNIIEKLYVTV